MVDVFGPEKRSQVMSAIRAKNTKPELIVLRIIRLMGYRSQHHVAALPGKPDIVISSIRTIVHVRGCFWHGHRCLKGRIPKANRRYWKDKILGNKRRDQQNDRRLRSAGWHVKTIWECAIRATTAADLHRRLSRLLNGHTTCDKAMRISAGALTSIDRAIASIRAR